MRRLLTIAATVVLVATLGAGAVVAARSVIVENSPSSQTHEQDSPPTFTEQVKTIQEDWAKPPFIGDVLGIYVIVSEEPVEDRTSI